MANRGSLMALPAELRLVIYDALLSDLMNGAIDAKCNASRLADLVQNDATDFLHLSQSCHIIRTELRYHFEHEYLPKAVAFLKDYTYIVTGSARYQNPGFNPYSATLRYTFVRNRLVDSYPYIQAKHMLLPPGGNPQRRALIMPLHDFKDDTKQTQCTVCPTWKVAESAMRAPMKTGMRTSLVITIPTGGRDGVAIGAVGFAEGDERPYNFPVHTLLCSMWHEELRCQWRDLETAERQDRMRKAIRSIGTLTKRWGEELAKFLEV